MGRSFRHDSGRYLRPIQLLLSTYNYGFQVTLSFFFLVVYLLLQGSESNKTISTSARSSEQGPVTPFTTHTLLPNGSSSKSNSSLPDMSQSSFVTAFFTLLILGGYLGMGLILLTIVFSSKVHRHPLFVNFLLCLMIYTTSFCFLYVFYLPFIVPTMLLWLI